MCSSVFYIITIVLVIDTLFSELRQESVCTAIIAHLSVGKTPGGWMVWSQSHNSVSSPSFKRVYLKRASLPQRDGETVKTGDGRGAENCPDSNDAVHVLTASAWNCTRFVQGRPINIPPSMGVRLTRPPILRGLIDKESVGPGNHFPQ